MFKNTKIFSNIKSFSHFNFHRTNFLSNLKKDFYKILNLNPNTPQEDIKKTYFKLAKEWHPDVNKSSNAKEKFSQISEAYDTLGDPIKRKAYDNYGLDADEQHRYSDFMKGNDGRSSYKNKEYYEYSKKQYQDPDLNDFWEEFDEFSFEESDFTYAKKNKTQNSKKNRDVNVNLEISFMESINGTKKTVKYERTTECKTCKGKKCKPGTSPSTCYYCEGTGELFLRQGYMTIQLQCNQCNGMGYKIKNPCNSCNGKGISKTNTKEVVDIPKGVENNMNLRILKKGNYSTNGPVGDLYVKLKVTPHEFFKRDNYDIRTENLINISTAVLGGYVKVKTVYGDTTVYVTPGTKNGDIKRLTNYGVSKLSPNQAQKGAHVVIFKIKIPTEINEKLKSLYTQLSHEEEIINCDFSNE